LKEIFPGYHGTAKDMSAQPWNPEEHFDKLSDEQQLKVMGPTRYALYKADKIKLTDLASKRESKIWGDCYVPRTVTELVESGKVTREDVDSARQS
jgi:radical SAM superfamily enzyme with C-terminal helix-hairpin-helix motif